MKSYKHKGDPVHSIENKPDTNTLYNDNTMFNDNYYDYKVNIKGKDFFIKLNFTNNRLYSWESSAMHLSEGAGGSVAFKDFQESENLQNFIRSAYGAEILEEIFQKIKEAIDPNSTNF